MPPPPITSPSSTRAAGTRQEPSTVYSNCNDAGPSTLKTCYTTTTSDLTGFTFPTPPAEDTQELDGSDTTNIPTPTPIEDMPEESQTDMPEETQTDMPEEAQTDMTDAPEATSEAVPTLAEMTAIVITTAISTYSTNGHGMIILPAAKTNLVADI